MGDRDIVEEKMGVAETKRGMVVASACAERGILLSIGLVRKPQFLSIRYSPQVHIVTTGGGAAG